MAWLTILRMSKHQTLSCLPDLVIIGLPITSSSDSILTSLSLSSKSCSYSSSYRVLDVVFAYTEIFAEAIVII